MKFLKMTELGVKMGSTFKVRGPVLVNVAQIAYIQTRECKFEGGVHQCALITIAGVPEDENTILVAHTLNEIIDEIPRDDNLVGFPLALEIEQ